MNFMRLYWEDDNAASYTSAASRWNRKICLTDTRISETFTFSFLYVERSLVAATAAVAALVAAAVAALFVVAATGAGAALGVVAATATAAAAALVVVAAAAFLTIFLA